MSDADLLRQRLKELDDVAFPDVVAPAAKLMQGVTLLVPVEYGAGEGMIRFKVGHDAHGRSWIYAYLDEAALFRGTQPGQRYARFAFDDLVEIAKANGFGGLIVDQQQGYSAMLLPEDYFELALHAIGRN